MSLKHSCAACAALIVMGVAPAAAQSVDGYLSVSDPIVTAPPRYDRAAGPFPHYPPTAIRKKQEGVVIVTMCVSPEGKPSEVRVTRSTGQAILDHATLDWMKNARFSPAQADGNPVGVCGFIMNQEWRVS